MYLNKLTALASVMVLMAGCARMKSYPLNADTEKITDDVWAETVKIAEIDPKTPKPETVFLDEELYLDILLENCETKTGDSQKRCLKDREKLEAKVLQKTGKDYAHRYATYIDGGYVNGEYFAGIRERLNDDCTSYVFPDEKAQCENRKRVARTTELQKVLGRTFLSEHYVEIYYSEIEDYLAKRSTYYGSYGTSFSLASQWAFKLSIIGHEYLHDALSRMGVPARDQHQEMRDTYMDPLITYVSGYVKTDPKGIHRDLAFGSLDVGIRNDNASKQADQGGDSTEMRTDYVLPCGLMIRVR